MGVRPEDVTVLMDGSEERNLTAPVYSAELTGDSTLVSVRVGDHLLTMRTDRNFRGDFDQLIGVRIPADRVYLFDQESAEACGFLERCFCSWCWQPTQVLSSSRSRTIH